MVSSTFSSGCMSRTGNIHTYKQPCAFILLKTKIIYFVGLAFLSRAFCRVYGVPAEFLSQGTVAIKVSGI